ncbi:MAG: hypothetical protein AAGG51_18335 [Cyanobacteria bacterium P01_G01_bin.54]
MKRYSLPIRPCSWCLTILCGIYGGALAVASAPTSALAAAVDARVQSDPSILQAFEPDNNGSPADSQGAGGR